MIVPDVRFGEKSYSDFIIISLISADSGVLTGLSSGQLTPQMSPPSQSVSLIPQVYIFLFI